MARWSPERVATLTRLYLDPADLSMGQIAARMGCTRNTAAGKLNRLTHMGQLTRRPGIAVQRPQPVTPAAPGLAHCDFILKAVGEGRTDREIAQHLGLTVQQVIYARQVKRIASAHKGTPPSAAARHRQEIARLAGMGLNDIEIARRLSLTPHQVRHQRRVTGVAGAKGAPPKPQSTLKAGDASDRVTAVFAEGYLGQVGRLSIVELRDGVCRFPIGDAPRYCGLETANGTSWCAHHAARVFDTGTPRIRPGVTVRHTHVRKAG